MASHWQKISETILETATSRIDQIMMPPIELLKCYSTDRFKAVVLVLFLLFVLFFCVCCGC